MNTLIIDHNNGHKTIYKLLKTEKPLPIAYNENTPDKVVSILENVRQARKRIRIYLGDIKTGECWNEENDIFGYVGLSKGNEAYYPLLVANAASFGGGSLMTDNIIKIKESKGGKVLYQAENFKQSIFEVKQAGEQEKILGYTHSVYVDGEIYSNHKTEKQAITLKNKLS